jgi:sugar lactone lactonase YvrE
MSLAARCKRRSKKADYYGLLLRTEMAGATASDPKRSDGTGRIWRIARGPDGKVRGEVVSSDMGLTNGIELSPDEQMLYVGESKGSSKRARLLPVDRPGREFCMLRPRGSC